MKNRYNEQQERSKQSIVLKGEDMLGVYINFRTETKDALVFYEEVFQTKVESVSYFKDMPNANLPEEVKELVMNSQMMIHGVRVMMSDVPMDRPLTFGTNMSFMIELQDLETAQKEFDALSAGGEVIMPLQKTFWGATFGQVRDRFGIQWFYNVA